MDNQTFWNLLFPGCDRLSTETVDRVYMGYDLSIPSWNYEDPNLQFIPHLFYPDGHLARPMENTSCPWQAPGLYGLALPWAYGNVEEGFSNRAARAAIGKKFLDGFVIHYPGFNVAFPIPAEGDADQFALCVVDGKDCDELWENGYVPFYVIEQMKVQQAFYRDAIRYALANGSTQYPLPAHIKIPAGRIQVVRCSSNVYSELTYRSLLFWVPELNAAKRKFLTRMQGNNLC